MKLENIIKNKAKLELKSISDYTDLDWVNYQRFGDYELLKDLATLPENTVIFTKLNHVSQSGMMRHIEMFYMVKNEPYYIRFLTEEFFNYHINRKTDAYHVGGCGMDMGFAIVHSLSYLVSNFKFPDKDQKKHMNGYYFKQKWI